LASFENSKKKLQFTFYTNYSKWVSPHVVQPTINKGFKRIKKASNYSECLFNETFISVWYAGDGTKILDSVGAKFGNFFFTVEEEIKSLKLFS
jgi:hypothetical protein